MVAGTQISLSCSFSSKEAGRTGRGMGLENQVHSDVQGLCLLLIQHHRLEPNSNTRVQGDFTWKPQSWQKGDSTDLLNFGQLEKIWRQLLFLEKYKNSRGCRSTVGAVCGSQRTSAVIGEKLFLSCQFKGMYHTRWDTLGNLSNPHR